MTCTAFVLAFGVAFLLLHYFGLWAAVPLFAVEAFAWIGLISYSRRHPF